MSNSVQGINCSAEDLSKGTCSLNTYELIGLENKSSNVTNFVQDFFNGLTFFIGTIVLVALVVSGLMLIFSAGDEKLAEKGKTGIKYALYGLILVVGSYSIIKLVQLVMRG